MGPLYCLTSGDGQVAWVRLDDVQTHFGVNKLIELGKQIFLKKSIIFC